MQKLTTEEMTSGSNENHGNNNRPLLLLRRHYSEWLRSTLTDMDRKTETVLEVLEDYRNASITRTEMPDQLVIHSLLSQLRSSYHAIADKCDSLLLMNQASQSSEFTSSSTSRSGEENVAGTDPGARLSTWDEMRMSVSELLEDNLRQQEELIKRNDMKREEIERLGVQLELLNADNAQLKHSLLLGTNHYKPDQVRRNKKRRHLLPRWISTWFNGCFKFDTTSK